MKDQRRILILICMEGVLIVLAIFLGILYTHNKQTIHNLENQVKSLASNDCTLHEIQISSLRQETESLLAANNLAADRKQAALNTVQQFLETYYGSPYEDINRRLADCSRYLTDDTIRQLIPYINSPLEITDETIQKIRDRDPDFLSDSLSKHESMVEDSNLYAEIDEKSADVFAYFTVSTKIGENNSNRSAYLFRCHLSFSDPTDMGSLMIDDILMKTPVILPTLDPSSMILN